MAQSNMEIPSTFNCMICLDTPKDPENCQNCSQFVCKLCIDNWFKKSTKNAFFTCPNCRKFVPRNNFKKIPCVENLLEMINSREKELEHSKMNECSQHAKQQLCVYCSTCSKAICAQCISSLFNGEHIDHVYSQLDSAQKRLEKILNEQEMIVQYDLSELKKAINDKTNIINQIHMRRKKLFDELEEFQIQIKNEINSHFEDLVKKIKNEQNILFEEINNYNIKYLKLKETIQSSNQIELFKEEKQLTEQILQRINLPIFDEINLSQNFINNPLAVSWHGCQITIQHFSATRKSTNPVLTSLFQLEYNQHWAIIIYPNGNGPHTGIYLSLMIQLKKGILQLIEYDVIVELVHHLHDDNQHNYSLKSTKSFNEGKIDGFEQFYELNKLSDNGFVNPQTDSLKIRIKFHPKSILEERKLFQWQIDFYKKELENKDEQNKEMNKIKDELIQLQQDNKNANEIIEDFRNKIQELEKNDSQYKRKRTSSNRLSRK